jgi:hypothetical protein
MVALAAVQVELVMVAVVLALADQDLLVVAAEHLEEVITATLARALVVAVLVDHMLHIHHGIFLQIQDLLPAVLVIILNMAAEVVMDDQLGFRQYQMVQVFLHPNLLAAAAVEHHHQTKPVVRKLDHQDFSWCM